MPPALAGASLAGSLATGGPLSLAAMATAGANTAASIILGVGGLALTAGLSIGVSALLAPSMPSTTPAGGQVERRSPAPWRSFWYGRIETSGDITFMRKAPGTDKLVEIVTLATREIDAIEAQYFDDWLVVVEADGTVSSRFHSTGNPVIQVFTHLGLDDQAADPEMLALFPDIWTADHRGRGCAYAVTVFNSQSETDLSGPYHNGKPLYKIVGRGAKVWDPRDSAQDPDDKSTWIWSDNAGLCILDWLTYRWGYNRALSTIDLPSFQDFANLCDELVPLKDGASERRYRVATQVWENESRTEVLARLRQAANARLYRGPTSGKLIIRGGKWVAPTVTLDTEKGHVIEASLSDGVDALTRYNTLPIKIRSPNHHYTETEIASWQNLDDPELVAGKVKQRPLDLTHVPSPGQGWRLAKQFTHYDNPPWIGDLRTNFYGLNTISEGAIGLNWSEPEEEDIDGAFFIEGNRAFLQDGTGMQFGVRAAVPESFDWNAATEELDWPPIIPPRDVEYTEGVAPDPVTGLSVLPASASAEVTWTPPVDPEFAAARVWRSETTDFDDAHDVSGPLYMPLAAGSPALTEMSFVDPVRPGTYYYWVTTENAVGDGGPVGGVAMAPVGPELAFVAYGTPGLNYSVASNSAKWLFLNAF